MATREESTRGQRERHIAHAVAGCAFCHGDDLGGGRCISTSSRNLTPGGIGHYTEAAFLNALREGKRPDGSPINQFMPLRQTKQLTDDEMRAIYAYLKKLPPRAFGENISRRSIAPT